MTEPASDILNSLALQVLPLLDPRYSGLLGLLFAGGVICWRRRKRMAPLNTQSVLNLVLSVMLQVNGLGVGCVLLLMSPPAIKGVGRDNLVFAGIVTLISCVSLGMETMTNIVLSESVGKKPDSQHPSEGQQ